MTGSAVVSWAMGKFRNNPAIWCPQEKVVVPGQYSKQKLVLGTHTSEGEQNYLMLAEVRLHATRAAVSTARSSLRGVSRNTSCHTPHTCAAPH